MEIIIVDKKKEKTDGFGRYSNSFLEELSKIIRVTLLDIQSRKIPKIIIELSKLIGFDIDFINKNNPSKLFINYNDENKKKIIHVMNQTLGIPFIFSKPKNLVVTVYDVMPLHLNYCRIKFFLNRLIYRLQLIGVKRADRIITTSQIVRQDIAKYLPFDINKIEVVPGGVDFDKFKVILKPKKFNHFNGSKKVILFVGSEIPRKNFARVLYAFAKVKQKIKEVKLLKVGDAIDNSGREESIRLIHELNLTNDVKFVGQVEEDLPHYYNQANLLVFTTLYEGFGLPPLEAMACGCPVLGSKTGSQPEVLNDAALLVDPYSVEEISAGMIKILEDASFANLLRERGLKRAGEFTWRKCAEETIKIYEKIISVGE